MADTHSTARDGRKVSAAGVLYAHDHKIRAFNHEMYSTGSIGDFQHYSKVFGKVLAVTRLQVCDALEAQTLKKLTNVDVAYLSVGRLTDTLRFDFLRKLWRSVRKSDAVVARMPSVLGTLTTTMAWSSRKPYLVELVGCPWDAYRLRSPAGRLAAPIMWAATRLLVKRSSRVVYVTEKFLQSRYPTRARAAAIANVVLRASSEDLRAHRLATVTERRETQANFVIGTSADVGVAYKGQKHVIRAVGRLREQGIDVYYRLAGGGDQSCLRHEAEVRGVSDLVQFDGRLPTSQIWRWYAELDVYVQPSETEGLPRSLIEAMSVGVPSAGSAVGGIPELLSDRYLFPAADDRAIVNTLTNMMTAKLALISTEALDTARRYDVTVLNKRRQRFIQEFYDEIA